MSNMNDEDRAALALANASPRTLRRVGIIGATSRGVRIAMDLLDAGLPVTLFERDRVALDAGLAPARPADRDDKRLALLAGTVNFHHLKDCDLIVDTVDTLDTVDTGPASREALFRRLDQTARPDAILLTLMLTPTPAGQAGIDRLARCTRRAGEVLGVQVVGAAGAQPVWELVRGSGTSGETLATVIALARTLGKDAAVADAGHGPAAAERAAPAHA